MKLLRTIIMGFGRAGRGLHIPCLSKARNQLPDGCLSAQPIGVVDPRLAGLTVPGGDVVVASLAELREFDLESTVVHICTQPEHHLEAIVSALEMGFRKLIVEKPLATSLAGAHVIKQLTDQHGADSFVVANWHYSRVTEFIDDVICSGELGPICSLQVVQQKERFERSLERIGLETVFDVEIPHQVALVMYLFGSQVISMNAKTTPLRSGAHEISHMGKGEIELQHLGNVRSRLVSNLGSTRRMRYIIATFQNGSIRSDLPFADSPTVCLSIADHNGGQSCTHEVEDDPLTNCLADYYRFLSLGGTRPISDFVFNLKLVALLDRARQMANVTG